MQNRERHSQTEIQGTLLRTPEESSKILSAMVVMATRTGKPFSGERMQQIHDDLGNYPLAAIEWALDSWARNAKVLPALSDLLQLLRTWNVENVLQQNCEPECQARHGSGYGTNDLMWLWKERQKSTKPWTEADYAAALTRLDGKRQGGPPEWRR